MKGPEAGGECPPQTIRIRFLRPDVVNVYRKRKHTEVAHPELARASSRGRLSRVLMRRDSNGN